MDTTFVKIELNGNKMIAIDPNGNEVKGILYGTRKSALSNGSALRQDNG